MIGALRRRSVNITPIVVDPGAGRRGSSTPFGPGRVAAIVSHVSGLERSVTARVAAIGPLLHRGLHRAAERAGFVVVGDHEADVTLRIAESDEHRLRGPVCSVLDVCLHPDAVVVTLRRPPDPTTTRLLHVLLGTLLDGTGGALGRRQPEVR